MPEETKKVRKKVVVEEVVPEATTETKIEVPAQTEPHIEPGIHEEAREEEEVKPSKAVNFPIRSIETPRTGPNPLIIIIPGVFLLGALLGGIIYYQKNTKVAAVTENKVTPSPAVSTPAPEPSPSVDVEKYNLKILNGSGTAGEAGKAQDLVEKEGFKVASTGNAANFNYTKTVIQAKKDAEKEFISKLSEALSAVYIVDAKTAVLPETSSDSVVVIIGSSKK